MCKYKYTFKCHIRGYFSSFSVKKQKERNTVKPSGKCLKLDEAVDDEDLQSTISTIVALEHSEVQCLPARPPARHST
jgi:cation transport regulator ChaC